MMERTVGNVVQSIPFVDANREDPWPGQEDGHPSGLCIPIAPIFDGKHVSPIVPA